MASLPQQTNNLVITGTLKSKFLEHKEFGGGDSIRGNIVVSYEEEGKTHNHRINIFAPQYSKAGKDMPTYKSIAKVENEFVAADDDLTNADRITVKGNVDYNIYNNQNGETRRVLRLSGNFFSRIDEGDQDTKDGADAELTITVAGYEDEIKASVPTNNKIVKNLTVGYNDRVNTVPDLKFDMNSLGDSIGDITDYFPIGSTMPIQIKLNNFAEKTETESHGFGQKKQIQAATKFVRENLITYVSTNPVTKESLNENQFNRAKQLFQDRLKPKSNSSSNQGQSSNPFDSTPTTDSEGPTLTDDDMPF